MNDLTAKVSDQMEKTTDKIKDQMAQVNESFGQLVCAGKGLVAKVSAVTNKQFNELVKAGEGKTFTTEIKNALPKISDAKCSIKQLRSATIGLISKSKELGSRYYESLVKEGECHGNMTTKSLTPNCSTTNNSNTNSNANNRPKTKTAA